SRQADTGVGAAMARGSQKCNGTWTLFASAATAIRAAATVVVSDGPTRSISSGMANVPYAAYSSTAPISMATAETTVTSSAITAEVRALLSDRSNPMR